MEIILSKYLWSITGLLTLPALLLGSVILYRRRKTRPTLILACSLAVAWLGQIIQMVAPFQHTTTYITDETGAVTGATGTFPILWYMGSIIASLAIIAAVISFIWFSIVDRNS